MSIAEVCANMMSKDGLDLDKILHKNIIEFVTAPWGLGLGTLPGVPSLYPSQRFILKVYYGLPLDRSSNRDIIIKDQFNEQELYRFNEYEYFKFLYEQGRLNKAEEGVPYTDLNLVIGRRGGKTMLTSCIIAYETYKLLNIYCPQEYYGIMPESEIRITCVATSKETASELFNAVTGHIERSEFFRRYRNKPTQQRMFLRTQRDIDKYGASKRASLQIHVAPCSAKGLRGHNNIIVALDEMAFFFEDEMKKGKIVAKSSDRNDRAIYTAVTPSVAKFKGKDGKPHGKIIAISSPNTKSGKFFELYESAFNPENTKSLMIQAPTWELDSNLSSEFLKNAYISNRTTYYVEYGAQFSDQVKAWIEDAAILRQNIIPGLKYRERSSLRVPHYVGVDVGLKGDGTAVCVCHYVSELVDGAREEFLEVDCCDIRYAELEKKANFTPQNIADWLIEYTKKFNIVKGLLDQYYGMGIIPLLEEKGVKQYEYRIFTEGLNSIIYQNLLTHFISSVIRLPEEERIIDGRVDKDSDLVKELLTLQATQRSKYIVSVEAPDRSGAHDDMSDALARAVFVATEFKRKGYGVKLISGSNSGARAFKVLRSIEMRKAELLRPARGRVSTGRRNFSPVMRAY